MLFTSGKLIKIGEDIYRLTLYNADGKQVYIGDVDGIKAAELIDKYYPNKITFTGHAATDNR